MIVWIHRTAYDQKRQEFIKTKKQKIVWINCDSHVFPRLPKFNDNIGVVIVVKNGNPRQHFKLCTKAIP
jgi:hypothetical protein